MPGGGGGLASEELDWDAVGVPGGGASEALSCDALESAVPQAQSPTFSIAAEDSDDAASS
jgi:hypothetical protein